MLSTQTSYNLLKKLFRKATESYSSVMPSAAEASRVR